MVVGKECVTKPSYRLTFSDGTQVIASGDHQWLGGKNRGLRWLTTSRWNTTIARKNQKAWVLKILDVVDQKEDYEHGWLGGFADGEGHYHGSAARGGGSWNISLHQAEGNTAERCLSLLSACNYKIRTETRQRKNGAYKTMCSHHINGGMVDTFRFLMECRPDRLIGNLLKGIEKKSIYTRNKRYVFLQSMEYLGEQDVIALETDTHTYIAEGLASHNCNVWRSLQAAPDEVARWCDQPVNHADLMARRRVLLANEADLLERLVADADWFDAKLAGYWVWCASCWIGSGLTGLHRLGAMPHLGTKGQGVHKQSLVGGTIPHLANGGRGVHKQSLVGQRLHLSFKGMGVHRVSLVAGGVGEEEDRVVTDPYVDEIYRWFRRLSERLRRVRVVCGDWSRVCGGNWQTHCGPCGIYFDPPYGVEDRDQELYAHDDPGVARQVAEWALERGQHLDYRIVLSGYYEEHAWLLEHGWQVELWQAQGGYANLGAETGAAKKNRFREVLFYSPHCVQFQPRMEGLL